MRHRPAPVVDALLALLKQDTTGIGVTTAELAARMNKSTSSVSAKLSRMRAYGLVTKTPENADCRHPQKPVRWRARERRVLSMIERRQITAKAEWLEWRKDDITASAIGALLCRHPYTTALKLHLEKRGVNFATPDNRVTRRGRWLEPAVRKAVSEERPGWVLEQADVYLRDGDLRLGATPDFFIHSRDTGALGVLQAKTTVPAELEKYWDGGKEIPGWIAWQTRTEMMLADAAFGAVAVLVVDPFDMDVHIIEIPRDTHAEDAIAGAVRKFWHDVERGIQPAADYGRDSDAIRALAGHERSGKQCDLSGDNQLRELLEQRAALKARAKAFEARCTEIENELMHKLGDAERGVGLDGWHITFKSADRAGYTVPPKTVRTLRITDRRPPEQRPDGGEDI